MQDQHPAAGGQPVRPEGNRPAHNARLSTPGALGSGSVPAGAGASDFLGLGEELGVPAAPQAGVPFQPAPAARPVPPPAPPLQAEAWEEYDAGLEGEDQPLEEVVSLDAGDSLQEVWEEYDGEEQAYEDADEDYDGEEYADEDYADEDAEPPPGVLAAWKEDEPARRGRGRLVGLCVGVGIVGMMGVAGIQLVNASKEISDALPEPLAAHSNPLPYANRVVPPTTPADGPVEPMRFVLDADGNVTPTETRAGFEPEAFDPAEQARSAFEAARGDAPPAGFDPLLDTPVAPASLAPDAPYEGSPMGLEHGSRTGRAEPVEDPAEPVVEVAQSSAPAPAVEEPTAEQPVEAVAEAVVEPPAAEVPAVEEPPLELVAGAATRIPPLDPQAPRAQEPAVERVAEAGAEPQPEPEPVELVAATPEISDPLPPPTEEPAAQGSAAGAASAWLQIALQRSQPPQGAAPTQGVPPPAPAPVPEIVQPASPAGATAQPAGTSPVDVLIASREPRPTRVVTPPVAPLPDTTGSLRTASSSDLATVWQSSELPLRESYDHPERVLTPNVGRVRVLLHSKDVFEGRLYAVGEGNVWLEADHGRMALQGSRVARIEQLTSREGTPVLGDTGSQDLAGMERVRVKTPGGTFLGKVIARDEKTTTLVTDDGARLTLDSKMVELLVDAPKVTIKGTAPDKEVADTKKP